METLSVGMYARTLNGIVKIDKIQDNVMEDTKEHLHYGNFIKASYNIIDIIEAGDYVNGRKVVDIFYDANDNVMEVCVLGSIEYDNNEIKSVITHEQMEQIAYKVGE